MKGFKSFSQSINIVVIAVASLGCSWTPLAAGSPADSVVTIYTQLNNESSGQGTGFVIGAEGRIATAYHVIQNATKIEVFDKEARPLDDVVIEWIDPRTDIAIIKAPGARVLPALDLSSHEPKTQEDVRVAGSPRGLPQQIVFGKITSAGYVSSLRLSSAGGRRIFSESIDVLPIDITIYSGMSGAPVLSNNGMVTGILSGSYDEGRGIAWAIPSKYISAIVDTTAINRRPIEMLSWPDLSLMRNGWISLKRSYSEPFSAQHIAKLESLETVFPTLRGEWESSGDERISIVYDDNIIFGRCEKLIRQQLSLNVDHLDIDSPRITGHQSLTMSVSSRFSHPQFLYPDTQENRRHLEGMCNDRIFSDRLVSERKARIMGEFVLVAKERSSRPNSVFDTTIHITDCEGSACFPQVYGTKEAGRLELISESRVRWQNAILSK